MSRFIPYLAGAVFFIALVSAESLVDRICETEFMRDAIPRMIESVSSMLIP